MRNDWGWNAKKTVGKLDDAYIFAKTLMPCSCLGALQLPNLKALGSRSRYTSFIRSCVQIKLISLYLFCSFSLVLLLLMMTCSDVANHRMEQRESFKRRQSVILNLGRFIRLQHSRLQRHRQAACRLLYVFKRSFTVSALGIGLDLGLGSIASDGRRDRVIGRRMRKARLSRRR
jgi:hypothetical protein